METAHEPKTVVLLGVPFHDVTMSETLTVIDEIVRAKVPRYIATANLDFAAQASDDVELQRILLDAHLVLCDGMPLIWASRWLDAPLRERVAGSDLTPRLAEHAAQRGYRLFFLGSDQAVLTEAKSRLEARYPGLRVCGTYAPPYARLFDLNNEEITAIVRGAKPDILLVALGAPKQEKWIHMHHRQLGVPCCIGIGASLDFVAGKFSRAPVWMQRTGLEWVYRLAQEPRRLIGRYAHDFLFFFRALFRQKQAMQADAPTTAETPEILSHPPGTIIYSWAGRIDAAGIQAGEVADPVPQAGQECVWVDAAEVTFVDSTGLGLLLKGFHHAKAAGGGLILLRPSASMRRMITSMKLDRLIPMADDEDQARTILQTERPAQPPAADFAGGVEQCLVCRWSGDLDLAKAKDFASHVQTQWMESESARLLQVDLSGVRFMDSSGLGSLLQTRKLVGGRPGARLELVGLNDNLRNVIRLARLEELLGGGVMIRVALSTSVVQRGKSGVASYIFGLLDGLRAPGTPPVELVLLGLEEDRPLFEPWLDRCGWEPVAERWRPAVRNIAWHQTALRGVLKRLRADVLHIPSYRRIVWCPPVPQVVTIHDCAAFAIQGKYDPARTFYGQRVVAPLARAADRLMTVSHATAADVERYFHVPAERIEVVWNGIDHAAFGPLPHADARRSVAEKFGLAAPFFLYLARLEHPGKNHVRLIEAFERFAADHPAREEHLVFGGADWHGAEAIHERVSASPLRGRIRSLGFVAKADLPVWYNAATAMIYPSLFEGFGLPPVEAMACGTPVISSTRGALGEVVGDAARLIDPESIADMAAAMGEVSPDDRERWGRKGIAHASQFRWENTARAVVESYLGAAKRTAGTQLIAPQAA